jgi:hypothetical protein
VNTKTNAPAQKNGHRQAVKELAEKLSQQIDNLSEPFVVENSIPQTNTLHSLIIWDRWSRLDSGERSKLILDAYGLSNRAAGKNITVAMGLTQREALELGFLRYSVISNHRKSDRVPLSSIKRAYEDVGGVVETIGSSSVHRFPTREAAETAYRRLVEKVPGPYWMIVHEVGTTGESS